MLTLGVDVAQGGTDETVLAPLYGTWFAPLIKRAASTPRTARRWPRWWSSTARRRADQHRPDRRLGRLGTRPSGGAGHAAEPVVFSQGSPERTKDGLLTFANKRSELWWEFREALDPNSGDGIALPPDRGSRRSSPRRPGRLRGSTS